MLLGAVAVGSGEERRPWSEPSSLLSDLKEMTQFLMLILGVCRNRADSECLGTVQTS